MRLITSEFNNSEEKSSIHRFEPKVFIKFVAFIDKFSRKTNHRSALNDLFLMIAVHHCNHLEDIAERPNIDQVLMAREQLCASLMQYIGADVCTLQNPIIFNEQLTKSTICEYRWVTLSLEICQLCHGRYLSINPF
jgi:hypothetical protein